jgi:tetratricopeptide (TPR) repeat protein
VVGVAPFVGREDERRVIDDLLAHARSGSGAAVVLTGATGIGKTRLAEEVVAAAARSFDVASAGCGPEGMMPPYWPWTQVLGDRLRGDDELRRRTEAEWPAAHRLVDPRHSPAPGPAPSAPDHDQARAELYEDVVSLLAAAAQRRPLLLVMDDLQNADSSSWLLLAHVAPRLRSLPVVVLATWRTDLQPPEPPAAALLRRVRVVPVPPLGLDQLGSLIDGVAGRAVDPGVAAAVHRRTSGNPLLAQEVVGALDARDGLDDAGAVATVVPESMRNLVGERLAALPPGTRQALAAGAALGTTFPLGVLANALGQDGLVLLDALNPALAAGLLTALEPAEAAFAHDVVRDVVLGLETAAGRARLHRQIGDALERLRGSGQNVDPVDLARHFLAAGPGSTAEGVRYAGEAGRRAMAMLAYEDAEAWFGQAAALARDQAPGVGAAERAELLLALGDAQEASGARAAARRSYLDAADEARAAGRPDLLAGAALGLSGTVGFEVSMLDRAQIDLLREARDALGPDDLSLRASVTARLAVAVSFLDHVEARIRMAEEAVALARGAGDEVALVQALAALCDAIAGPDHVAARTGLAAEIVGVGTRLRDPRIELLGRRLSVVALLEQGDVDGADREIQAFSAAAVTMRRPFYSWYVPLWRAMRAGMDGRLTEAWAALAEAEAVVAESDTENGPMLTTTLRWHLLSELDHTEEIDALLAGASLDELPGVWPLVTRSLCAAQLGQPDASRALLDTAAARLPDVERDSEWLPMLAQVAEIVGLLGAHPVAAWAYDALLPYRSLFAVEGIGAGVRGPVERSLGALAASLGRREDAEAHFDAALAAAERLGAGLVVARTLRDAGASLGHGDRLAEARRRYQALGADRRVAEIDRLLRGGGDEAPPPQPVAGNVFRLEGEVWRLVHAGREVRLRDSKGLRDLARMLAEPARPFPAVELAGAPGGVARGDEAGAEGLHAQGDLGELVDARAREAYRRRLADLDEEIDDADRAADVERSAKAAAEKEALVAHLAAAYGLGGRPRRTGDTAERARQTVTARIREAMTRIESVHPDLGRHLRRSVRTGRICVYEPDSPIEWST